MIFWMHCISERLGVFTFIYFSYPIFLPFSQLYCIWNFTFLPVWYDTHPICFQKQAKKFCLQKLLNNFDSCFSPGDPGFVLLSLHYILQWNMSLYKSEIIEWFNSWSKVLCISPILYIYFIHFQWREGCNK